eukprot:5199945-Alexandrium_andersonii.AAC.1
MSKLRASDGVLRFALPAPCAEQLGLRSLGQPARARAPRHAQKRAVLKVEAPPCGHQVRHQGHEPLRRCKLAL